VFHHIYREQVVDDMQTYARVINGMVSSAEELEALYTNTQSDLRVTAVNTDGAVVYDSKAGDMPMDNHADRPEIVEAEQNGEGYSIRHSDTLRRDMYYYAIRLESGDILRVSKEADSIWSV